MSTRAQRPAKGKPGKSSKKGRYGSRRRIPWIALVLVLLAVAVAFFIVRALELGAPGERRAVAGVGQHITEGQSVQYDSTPPAGGAHWPAPASWGISSIAIPDERIVHNLEHGGVVISYNQVPAPDLATLRSLIVGYPRDRFNEVKVVVRPYDKIPAGTVVLAAWGWLERLTVYDDATVRAFLDAHLNRCCESQP